MVNLETVTHVAGPPIRVGERIVQRCPVCGEKLADNADPMLGHFWGEAELIRVTAGGNLKAIKGNFLNRKNLPEDFCIALVER